MTISDNLFRLASELVVYKDYESKETSQLLDSAKEVGRSWSGSWLGYHSRVYYAEFQIPPLGANFSQEWGLMHSYAGGTTGNWKEYTFDDVIKIIYEKAGQSELTIAYENGEKAKELFESVKSSTLSIVHANFDLEKDNFLKALIEEIEGIKPYTENDFIKYYRPSGQIISRDTKAFEKGLVTPPHLAVMTKVLALNQPFEKCEDLNKAISKLASYIENLEKKAVIKEAVIKERVGTSVFIGHGRSPCWRELKDFINDRIGLPWDEFNRVPVAGVTNVMRLVQMLDQASIAFLIMTSEDEQINGKLHARMNVIHEVGLFQGRLGFEKAIVLLEEGCQEFSNIQGLGQIRFPKGNISAAFEDIRQVLEREGIIG